MEKTYLSLVFSAGLSDIKPYNSSFDQGLLSVCYTGKNRNKSFISKETFERCMPSIYNCPIVCHYDRETDSIGAHDVELVSDEEGIRLVNTTHPVGVVPESARVFWETRQDESGKSHEYLCVDVLLWKRQEAYRKIKADGITDESMEISVLEGTMKDGTFMIHDFEFTAFCLLGSAEPCYEGASLELFSNDGFRTQLAEMMHEWKESFATLQHSKEVVIENDCLEGGKTDLDKKLELLAQYGLTVEGLTFSLDEFTEEQLTEKFEALKAEKEQRQREEQFALAEQLRRELYEALSVETVERGWGTCTRYWYVDHDAEACEVYCNDIEEKFHLFGMPYSMNGDHVVVDFGCKKRKKYAIVDYDEGEQMQVFSQMVDGVVAGMTAKMSAANTEWEQKFAEAEQKTQEMQCELDSLRTFKLEAEAAERKAAQDAVFAKFEDLAGVEAFEALREDCGSFSLDELEEKCFAMRGRQQTTAKFSMETGKVKLPVEHKRYSDKEDEPYGGAFVEYGF